MVCFSSPLLVILTFFPPEEQSPLAREEMLKIAAELAKLAKELPELANKALKSPNDPVVKKQLQEKIRELEKAIDRATAPVKEKLQLLPNRPTPIGGPLPVPKGPSEKARSAQVALSF